MSNDATLILQVPTQTGGIPENVQRKADKLNIKIEEVPDTVKEREEKEKSDDGCKNG